MTSTVMMSRTSTGVQSVPGVSTGGMPSVSPTGTDWLTVPRCTFKFEKVQGGVKVHCVCEDQMARSMLQHLCQALMGGMCSVYCMMNGQTVCCCNLTMGMCKVEMTSDGCCVVCTSGDQKCCEMIQSCCDCLSTCCNSGCTCCLTINNNPVCCGYSESYSKTTTKR